MPALTPHIEPRQLRALVRAQPSADARARTALQFLLTATGAPDGFLFVWRSAQLTLAASSSERTPEPELIEAAARAFAQELERPPEDASKTLEIGAIQAMREVPETPAIRAPNGEPFERRILSTYVDAQWVPIGLSLLRTSPERRLAPVRRAQLEAICNALLDAGDVVSAL